MAYLEEEQEWNLLEYWTDSVWLRCPKTNEIPEDLERVTLLLLRRRPGVAKKLEQLLLGSVIDDPPECLEYLRRVPERVGLEAASRQDIL